MIGDVVLRLDGITVDYGGLRAVDDVVARHPEQVAQVRSGKDRVIGFLVGQLMQKAAGAANPKLASQHSEYLQKQLANFKPQGAKKAEREKQRP